LVLIYVRILFVYEKQLAISKNKAHRQECLCHKCKEPQARAPVQQTKERLLGTSVHNLFFNTRPFKAGCFCFGVRPISRKQKGCRIGTSGNQVIGASEMHWNCIGGLGLGLGGPRVAQAWPKGHASVAQGPRKGRMEECFVCNKRRKKAGWGKILTADLR